MSLKRSKISAKRKRGISGAITALILVIASVIIALAVVSLAFGFFGAFSSSPTVTQIGSGTITTNGVACVTLKSTGTVTIVSATFNGGSVSPHISTITAGTGTYSFTVSDKSGILPGSTYTITLTLSNGQTLPVTVIGTT
ncbi:DUF973 family protein [Candidatus Acidianus copahuensis]